MLKAIGLCGYYFSVLLWYGFFFGLAAVQFIAYFIDDASGNCYAYMDKSLTLPLTTSGDNLKDITANFKLASLWGAISFLLIGLLLMSIHIRYWCDRYAGEWWICPAIILVANWVGYFLTLMSLRLRHAGKVCAGDYLPNRLLFNQSEPPYLHNSGLILWYAIIAQWGFFVVMISGAISIAD